MSRLLYLILLTLVAGALSIAEEVPTYRDTYDYKICHYMGTLVEVTQHHPDDLLIVNDLDLLAIREDAFKNVSATHLHLNEGNRISALSRGSFRGLPKLEQLRLDGNAVRLSGNLFAELGQLQSLVLAFNKIIAIPRDSFAGLASLEWLYLGYNDIRAIETDTFSSLHPGLLYLSLNANEIARVAAGSFAGLTELKGLNLDYNRLEGWPSGAFRGLNKLEILYLSNNRITNVSAALFSDLVGLKMLDLQRNGISALEPGTFRDLSRLEVL